MLEIVLPFGLPPDELAKDLLAALHAPALAQLLARSHAPRTRQLDAFSPQLPHEAWLDHRLGAHWRNACALLQRLPTVATDTDIAANAANNAAIPADSYWFVLQPVHLHVARDHLVLTDPRQLPLTELDARALFASAAAVFQEAGMPMLYVDAHHWLLRADGWQDMQTASLDAACGHNIDIWMAKGEHARAWRKLQNEVQMTWFGNAVNLARETSGQPVVNSLWLHGGAVANTPTTANNPARPNARQILRASESSDPVALATLGDNPILYADTLISPALASDWSSWLQAFALLDQHWFAPLLQSPRWPLRLIFGNSHALREFDASQWGQLAFWRKSGLMRLLP